MSRDERIQMWQERIDAYIYTCVEQIISYHMESSEL